jgi:hypothetical protein
MRPGTEHYLRHLAQTLPEGQARARADLYVDAIEISSARKNVLLARETTV